MDDGGFGNYFLLRYTAGVKTFFRSLSWAAYLGMSWTWCIGMFLPVILVSEFGIGAWLVFAIPNILGALAMGWTLAAPGASEKIVSRHRTACVAFSAVTLAFHAFFLLWFSSVIIPRTWCIAAVSCGTLLGFIGRKRAGWDLLLAWIVLGVSLTVLGKGAMHARIPDIHGVFAYRAPMALQCLSVICIFGFLLCPYLDLTFHRAKQSTSPGEGRFAFTWGFGVFFLAMIVLTLLYVGDFSHSPGGGSFGLAGIITWVALHMAVQIGFTWAAHLRVLPAMQKSDAIIWIIAGSLVLAAFISLRQQQWFNLHDREHAMLTGELVYRLFMGFYGLVFPAYVWVCMVPLRGNAPGPSKAALVAVAIGVLIAAPMFWAGFIHEKMIWLIPGVAVVLCSRLLVTNRLLTPRTV